MTGSGRRRDADELLVAALAAGLPIEGTGGAAERAGVSPSTARRRLAEPAFAARVRDAREALVAQAYGRLTDALAGALDVLRGLLASPSERVRLDAAKAVLSHTLDARDRLLVSRELEELKAKLEAIEAAGESEGGGRGGRL
jgi:hypothetical protein